MSGPDGKSGRSRPLNQALGFLAAEGAMLAAELADHAHPRPQSTIQVLTSRSAARSWRPADIRFFSEATRALAAVMGAQLDATAHVLKAGPSIHLHPLVTLVRGVAEASGKIWWLSAPLMAAEGEPDPAENEWDALAQRVLHRSQLARMDALMDRRRRIRVTYGTQSSEYEGIEKQIETFKEELNDVHDRDHLRLSDGRKKWRIGSEQLPTSTDMVTAATEYAYGERYRGSGMNPYPMYSGYAHASVELVFAHALSGAPPISTLIHADNETVRRLGGSALRTFAVGFEIAAHIFDWSLTPFRHWEERVDEVVLEGA